MGCQFYNVLLQFLLSSFYNVNPELCLHGKTSLFFFSPTGTVQAFVVKADSKILFLAAVHTQLLPPKKFAPFSFLKYSQLKPKIIFFTQPCSCSCYFSWSSQTKLFLYPAVRPAALLSCPFCGDSLSFFFLTSSG